VIPVYEQFHARRKYIEDALEYAKGTHTIDDIWNGIVDGTFQFWPGEKSAIITEVQIYPQKKAMHIFLAGGDLNELLEMEKSVRAFAETIGCNSMSISGRRGWLRIFERDGWEEICTTIAKEL
jgi:hypothetical protein